MIGSQGSSKTSTATISPNTNVLHVLDDGSYGKGWVEAQSVPLLRYASCMWYYEKADGSVSGPVSCRVLSSLLNAKSTTSAGISLATRVYSTVVNEWKSLKELNDLLLVMEVFVQAHSHPTQEAHISHLGKESELEAFLSSTVGTDTLKKRKSDDDDASFESDNGTRYVKDPVSGNWVHEALFARFTQQTIDPEDASEKNKLAQSEHTRKKKKKAQFASKNARCWIYVTGLPEDATDTELALFFSKAGIISLDPETHRPKIKLYIHKDKTSLDYGKCKGDASICFARPESVELAITLYCDAPFRAEKPNEKIHVEKAKFEQQGKQFDATRRRVSNAKRAVAKLAAIQARDWDDGEFNGRLTGGRKGLRIIVLKKLFDPFKFSDPNDEEKTLNNLERDLREACAQWGEVEKITMFSKNPDGVVVVKFSKPGAASEAVKGLNGRDWKSNKIEAGFWDGVTDFTTHDEILDQQETQKRHEDFGSWLDNQEELPEELRLKEE